MTSPGSTKPIEARVPAAEAMVWTMLFSKIDAWLNPRSSAIEMTAAGIDVAKVSPIFSPRYRFAAVNSRVSRMPSTMPRSVSSAPFGSANTARSFMVVIRAPSCCRAGVDEPVRVRKGRAFRPGMARCGSALTALLKIPFILVARAGDIAGARRRGAQVRRASWI